MFEIFQIKKLNQMLITPPLLPEDPQLKSSLSQGKQKNRKSRIIHRQQLASTGNTDDRRKYQHEFSLWDAKSF